MSDLDKLSTGYFIVIAILAIFCIAIFISVWIDGSKRLDECQCVACMTATPKATAEMESEWGY